MGHLAHRQHLGDDALVAVAPHQLVARPQDEVARDPVFQAAHAPRTSRRGIQFHLRRIFNLHERRRGGVDILDFMDARLAALVPRELGYDRAFAQAPARREDFGTRPFRPHVENIILLFCDGHRFRNRVTHHDRVVEVPAVPGEVGDEQVASDLQRAVLGAARAQHSLL